MAAGGDAGHTGQAWGVGVGVKVRITGIAVCHITSHCTHHTDAQIAHPRADSAAADANSTMLQGRPCLRRSLMMTDLVAWCVCCLQAVLNPPPEVKQEIAMQATDRSMKTTAWIALPMALFFAVYTLIG